MSAINAEARDWTITMKRLVNENGLIDFGLYDATIDEVNYEDYRLETPMGVPVPRALRKRLAKQFHFIGIIGPELVIGLAVVDLKYICNAFLYAYERGSGRMTEQRKLGPGGARARIDAQPDTGKSTFDLPGLSITVEAGKIRAHSERVELDVDLELSDANPLRICTRAGYRGWAYTQKTTPVPLSGYLKIDGKRFELSSPEYMGLTDWTCGFMRRETFWAWASTATSLSDGRALGLNLSCGVNETSYTENAFWVGGVRTKVDTVDFVFDRDDLMKPWRISSQDGKVDLAFHPDSKRGERLTAVLLSSRFTQLIGTFDGCLTGDDGERIEIEGCPGFTEDHYAKW